MAKIVRMRKTFQKVDNSRRNAGGEERSYMVS